MLSMKKYKNSTIRPRIVIIFNNIKREEDNELEDVKESQEI